MRETPNTALGRAASNKCTTAMHIYCDLRITFQVTTVTFGCAARTRVLLSRHQDWGVDLAGFNLAFHILQLIIISQVRYVNYPEILPASFQSQ
jgi:hypothetical protein